MNTQCVFAFSAVGLTKDNMHVELSACFFVQYDPLKTFSALGCYYTIYVWCDYVLERSV